MEACDDDCYDDDEKEYKPHNIPSRWKFDPASMVKAESWKYLRVEKAQSGRPIIDRPDTVSDRNRKPLNLQGFVRKFE